MKPEVSLNGRIHTAGNMSAIFDGDTYPEFDPLWFDQARWRAEGKPIETTMQRGSVLVLERGSEAWVHRHYQRGGFAARLVYDHYLWLGLERSRPFREWRLLNYMHRRGLPTPRPVAARVLRRGLAYQADIVTVYLPATTSVSSRLREGDVDDSHWTDIGAMVRRIHDQGIDHPDLTAHNILLDPRGKVFVVDFDNARFRSSGSWRQAALARLQRSLRKVALETGTEFDQRGWGLLLDGYR